MPGTRSFTSLALTILVLAGIPGPPASAQVRSREPECTDLVASQSEAVGSVCVRTAEGDLHVTIATLDEARLAETRIMAVAALGDFPLSESGVPKLGLFPYADTHQPPVTSVPYALPLEDVMLAAGEVLIAVHASVIDEDGVEHGAWAGATRFRTPGSPASYFVFSLRPGGRVP